MTLILTQKSIAEYFRQIAEYFLRNGGRVSSGPDNSRQEHEFFWANKFLPRQKTSGIFKENKKSYLTEDDGLSIFKSGCTFRLQRKPDFYLFSGLPTK